MNISDSIMILLRMCGLRQLDLLQPLGMSSPQSLSNKFAGNRWSASDLIKVADATGATLSFRFADGKSIDLN